MPAGSSATASGPSGSAAPDAVGDLAIVLHSHMPYVEGFGTYPFGEEWLFDAFVRSHLPVLERARDLTLTVSPVLADQLEAGGVPGRMREFVAAHRIGAAERDAAEAPERERPAARAQAERYRDALARLDELGGVPLDAFRAARDRGVELAASAATHAVLPLVATDAGVWLQIDAGVRSHTRRFGAPAGFWLPECAYRAGLESALAEAGIGWFCVDQSAEQPDSLAALSPVRTAAGPVAFPIDWETIERVWSRGGYPSDPAYAQFAGLSNNGTRLWAIEGGPYEPELAARRAREHAGAFADVVAMRLARHRQELGRRGLVTFATDAELLGHWWSEGPLWLEALIEAAPARGIELVTLSRALERHEPDAETNENGRALRPSTWGEDKDLSTWDAPAVADLAWASRRLELRLLRELGAGRLSRAAAMRATRELLAVQSSDWAFLDSRREAGDYPYRRATEHAEALLEAIDSPAPDPRMRNLAPDLSLVPLLEP